MKRRFRRLSIQNKFFFTMLTSSVLALLMLLLGSCGVYLYYFVQSETTSSQNQLGYISQQLGFFLQSVEDYAKTIRTDGSVQQVFHEYKDGDERYVGSTLQVTDQLHHIIQSTPYIHAVALYGLDGELLATTEIVPNPPEREAFINQGESLWIPLEKYGKRSVRTKQHAFSYFSRCYSIATGEELGFIEVMLPESSVSDIYSSYTSGSFSILVADAGGTVRSSTNAAEIGQSYPLFASLTLNNGFARDFTGRNVVFTQHFPQLDWYIINQIDLGSFFVPMGTAIGLFFAVTLLCAIAYSFAAHRLSGTVTTPLQQLVRHTQTIREGDWSPVDEGLATDVDTERLFHAFNEMLRAQEALRDHLLEAEKAQTVHALNTLQEQINPHFLYNTLDNMAALAEMGENETLLRMILDLSRFYRESLSGGNFIISVAEELAITQSYLRIMQIRRHGRFTFSVHCPDELTGLETPKLLLQPIVENSIEHGFTDKARPGHIHIEVSQNGEGRLVYTVQDNGSGLSKAALAAKGLPPGKSFGLVNVDKRIRLYGGEGCGLEITNGDKGGCVTTLTVGKGEVEQ